MDCTEARACISAGIAPGAGPGHLPELGFHLSGCPACRAFRRIDLFDREQARRARMSGPPEPIAPAASRRLPHWRARLTAGRATAALALVLCVWLGWYFGLPLLHAWQDLGAMASLPPVQQVAASAAEPPQPAAPPLPAASPTEMPATETPTPPARLQAEPSATASPRLEAGAARPFAPEPTNILTPTPEPTMTPTPPPTEPPPTPTLVAPQPPAEPPTPTTKPQPAPPVQAAAPAPGSSGGVTVLLLGLDTRPGETTGRSDALIVAHVDPEQQTAALLSLPRDLWVTIPGIGEGKINGAYVQGGAQASAAAVGRALGISIDQTVVIDFGGFRGLIDALGGVTVDVPRELYDPKFPTDDYGIVEAHFLPGPQVMNGNQALTYSRIRHPDSDFARMRRQQAVLIGISAKLRKLGAAQSLHQADRLTGALRPYVRTTMERGAAAQLLWSLRNVNPASVHRLVLDGSMLQETTIAGSYALVADSATLRSLGARLIAP